MTPEQHATIEKLIVARIAEMEKRPYFSANVSPCLQTHTWTNGTIDIRCEWNYRPFVFMCVHDGVWDQEHIFPDKIWENEFEDKSQPWVERHVESEARRRFAVLHRNDIIAKCRWILTLLCPSSIKV